VAKTGYRELVSSEVASILKKEREKRGLSMTRVAEMSGLSQGMISLIERQQRNPSLDSLLRICIALNIQLSSVLTEAERTARSCR